MKLYFPLAAIIILLISSCQQNSDHNNLEISLLVPENKEQKSIDGRLLLILQRIRIQNPDFRS